MKHLLGTFIVLALGLGACESAEGPVYSSMVQGGEWFLNNQDETFLEYIYHPETDEHEDDEEGYVDEIRELASWWAITELAMVTEDPKLWELADRGYDAYMPLLTKHEVGQVIHIEGSNDPIAHNAFALLALMNMDEEEGVLRDLGDALVAEQEESGRINTFFGRRYTTSNTDYYPGEALLALMRLYEKTGVTAYKAAVSQAFEYYAFEYWPENQNTAFVPWQSQAYYPYYLETEDPRVKDFIFEMNDFLISQYVTDEQCQSFEFKGVVTAVHIEGINKAYALADREGDEARMACYGEYIRQGLDFVMSLQYPLEGMDPNDLPGASLGGFMATTENPEMRVDRNQHAIMAMLGALELKLVK